VFVDDVPDTELVEQKRRIGNLEEGRAACGAEILANGAKDCDGVEKVLQDVPAAHEIGAPRRSRAVDVADDRHGAGSGVAGGVRGGARVVTGSPVATAFAEHSQEVASAAPDLDDVPALQAITPDKPPGGRRRVAAVTTGEMQRVVVAALVADERRIEGSVEQMAAASAGHKLDVAAGNRKRRLPIGGQAVAEDRYARQGEDRKQVRSGAYEARVAVRKRRHDDQTVRMVGVQPRSTRACWISLR